jgi:hypothetical protein
VKTPRDLIAGPARTETIAPLRRPGWDHHLEQAKEKSHLWGGFSGYASAVVATGDHRNHYSALNLGSFAWSFRVTLAWVRLRFAGK